MSTTCAATTRTTSAKRSSRPSAGRFAWRSSSISSWATAFRRPRKRSEHRPGVFTRRAASYRVVSMSTIAVVDYSMGNLYSVAKALEHVAPKWRVVVTGDAAQVAAADRVVFPGQGAMPDCVRHLAESGLHEEVLRDAREEAVF